MLFKSKKVAAPRLYQCRIFHLYKLWKEFLVSIKKYERRSGYVI